METRTFATYGVFLNGRFVSSGDMMECMFNANQMALNCDESDRVSVSTFKINEEDTIVESTQIMRYRKTGDVIFVIGMLE